jgi:hypothetical protein
VRPPDAHPRRIAPALGAAALALLAAPGFSSAADSPPAPARMLPRSSIAAVLSHRSELRLDDDQVRRLERMDDELQRRNAELPAGSSSPRRGGEGARQGGRPAERDAEGGAEGMGRPGGRHGPGSPRAKGEPRRAPADPDRVRADNDTAAYLQAEELLRPEQRDRAREIAERYREELYDQRNAAGKAAGR